MSANTKAKEDRMSKKIKNTFFNYYENPPTPSTELLGETTTTGRGFGLVKFHDENNKKCSLQISSRAVCSLQISSRAVCSLQISSRAVCENEDGTVADPLGWIWLGIDDAEPQILKSHARKLGMEIPEGEFGGWMPYPLSKDVLLSTRMHLNEKQVRGLIARLQTWLDSGEFQK